MSRRATVVGVGLIGGSIGLGTLLFAFLMGPSMQAAFNIAVVTASAPAAAATVTASASTFPLA